MNLFFQLHDFHTQLLNLLTLFIKQRNPFPQFPLILILCQPHPIELPLQTLINLLQFLYLQTFLFILPYHLLHLLLLQLQQRRTHHILFHNL